MGARNPEAAILDANASPVPPARPIWGTPLGIAERMLRNIGRHALSISAAAIAFYGMLAAFPALAAFIALYALMADPVTAIHQFGPLRRILPQEVWSLFHDQLVRLTSGPGRGLGFGAFFGLAITVWSAGAGVRSLITALNVVYMEKERRGLLRFYFVATMFTFAAISLGVIALTTIVVTPILLRVIDLGSWSRLLISVIRWPIILGAIAGVLVLFYKYGASRTAAQGALDHSGRGLCERRLAGGVVGLFSAFVSEFNNYNETYGTLGGVVVLLTWFYISAFLVLLGAELNAALEQLATVDTTEGPPRPPGTRGARVADTAPNVPIEEPTLAEAAGKD